MAKAFGDTKIVAFRHLEEAAAAELFTQKEVVCARFTAGFILTKSSTRETIRIKIRASKKFNSYIPSTHLSISATFGAQP